MKGQRSKVAAGIRFSMLFSELIAEHRKLGLGLGQSEFREQAGHNVKKIRLPILHSRLRVLTKRCKSLRLSIQLKIHGSDAHDFVRLSTKNQRFTYSRWPSTVSALPKAVANDDYRCPSTLVFFRSELSPPEEIDAEHGEQTGRNFAAVHVLRLP